MEQMLSRLTLENVAYVFVAATLLASAFRVVTTRNLVHSVFWLGLTLATTAVLYILLRSPFLAGVQILLYTGGVITLMLFGVMLTQRAAFSETAAATDIENESSGHAKGALVALATFGVISGAVMTTEGLPTTGHGALKSEAIGQAFLTDHLMAFEVLSVLLLIVMVGAIVLARKKDDNGNAARSTQARPGTGPSKAAKEAA